MTNIKEKITSKKGKALLFATIIAAMAMSIGTNSVVDVFATEKVPDNLTDKEKNMNLIEGYVIKTVKQTSKSDIDRIDKKIKSDQSIKDLTKNKELKLVSHSYHGNLNELGKNPNASLDVIMHYTMDDKSVTVMVAGETNDVLSIDVGPIGAQLLPNHAIVGSYLTSGGPSINGLRMDLTSPDFDGEPLTNWVALLLNAKKSGSSGNICSSANFPTAYWAQNGMIFQTDGDMDLIWTDTTVNCSAQTLASSISSAHDLTFWIQTESSISAWAMYAYDATADDFWSHTEDGLTGQETIATGTFDTSVFFENPTSIPDNEWSLGFNEDPTVDVAYSRASSNGVWDNWYDDTLFESSCYPGNSSTGDYMSGNLETGLTFDVSLIDTDCATD